MRTAFDYASARSIGMVLGMDDIVFLTVLAGFFIVSGLYVGFCEKL